MDDKTDELVWEKTEGMRNRIVKAIGIGGFEYRAYDDGWLHVFTKSEVLWISELRGDQIAAQRRAADINSAIRAACEEARKDGYKNGYDDATDKFSPRE